MKSTRSILAHPSSRSSATILFVAWAPFFSGAERALAQLTEHLDRSKYVPVVAVGTDGELASRLRGSGVKTITVPIAYTGRRILRWTASVRALSRVIRSVGASIVHANDLPSFQAAGYAARLTRTPAVAHIRFPDAESGYRWFLKPGFSRAVFISRSLRDSAVAEAPDLFSGRSQVVYDGTVNRSGSSLRSRASVRRALGLPTDRMLVVLSGQVAEVKGIWEFIEAASILRDRASVDFVVLGEDLRSSGVVRQQAQRAVSERGLASRVHFVGFKPNAPDLLPAFDIVAVPSHVEPFGLSVVEGMAAALPVIGSRVGGIPELVIDGVTGLLIPPRDAPALACAIESLLADPERADSLGRAGRTRVGDHFSIETHAREIERLYDDLLARTAAREHPAKVAAV